MSAERTDHRRPGATLYRYMMRQMVFPTAFALAGLTFVVLTMDVLGYSDLIINRGLGAELVGWIAFYQTVPLASQMLPLAVLLGSLVALGRMGADLELLSLEAAGLSARRMIGPIVAFASLATLGGFGLSLFGAPAAARALDATLLDISERIPGAVIRAGVAHEFEDWRIEAREVSADGRRLRGVSLFIPSVGETIFAERAEVVTKSGGGTEFALESGAMLPNPRVRPRIVRFDRLRARLPRSATEALEREGNELAGASLEALLTTGRGAGGKIAREAWTEFHRRFALPVATLTFGVLVLPLFLRRAHFSRGGGAMLGLLAILVYYGLVQVGNGIIQARVLGVAAGVWLPNIVLLVAALVLLRGAQRTSALRQEERRSLWRRQVSARIDGLSAALRARRERRVRAAAAAREERGPRPLRVHRFALDRYVASRFLQVALLCFAILAVAYVVVDMLERLQQFAKYDATVGEVLRFYSARTLVLSSRVVPMALLVATALTVALLAVQGELTGISCSGIAASRGLLPVLVICALVVPLSFVFNNNVATRAEVAADYVKDTQIKNKADEWERVAEDGARIPTVWYRVGNHFYEAERFDPKLGFAQNITTYELGPDGLPRSRADARRARHIGGGVWRLLDPIRVEEGPDGIRAAQVAPFAELGEEVPAEVDTKHLSVAEILREIEEVREAGYDATVYRVDFFAKLATPFACLVLPALALFFCIAGPPFPSTAVSLVLATGTAVAYTLVTGIGISLGYAGALPPALAGSASTTLFAVLALYFGLRLRGFGQRP